MGVSSSDEGLETIVNHLFETTKRKPSVALLNNHNKVKYCLNTQVNGVHSKNEPTSVNQDASQMATSIPFFTFLCGCCPILNWKWFIPPRWTHLLESEGRLTGITSDEENFDYYPVSKEAKTFHELRSFCFFTVGSIYFAAFVTFFWSQVLVSEPYSPNRLFYFFMMYCVILFSNAFFVKKEFYSFQKGMFASSLLCTLLLSSCILVTGGNKSPAFLSLFGLIFLFSSFAGQKAANCLGAYIVLFDGFLLLHPEYSISMVDENYQFMITIQERLVSIAVTLLVIHWNRLKSESDSIVLNNCVVHSLHADKSKTFFLASTAHEMRTPLHHINLINKLLPEKISNFMADSASDSTANKHHSEVLALIQQEKIATQLLLTLIDDALDLRQIEVGEFPLKVESINMDTPVINTCKMFLHLAEERNIQFKFEDKTNEINTIFADKTRLVHILSNLLGNAFKFTPDDGAVTVTIERKTIRDFEGHCEGDNGDRICISVKDNGIGIPLEDIESIFYPFSQVDGQSTTRKYRGGGLGLAITKKLATLMNANLTVQSQEGIGSIFSVWFQPFSGDLASSDTEHNLVDNIVERNPNIIETENRQSLTKGCCHRGLSTKIVETFTSEVTPSIAATSATPTTNNNYKNSIDRNIGDDLITPRCSCTIDNNNNDNNNNYYSKAIENCKLTSKNPNSKISSDILQSHYNNASNAIGTIGNDSLEESRIELEALQLNPVKKENYPELKEFPSNSCGSAIRKKDKRKRVKATTKKVLEGSHIILCDDNVVSLKLLSVMLKNLGCHVTTFEHPRDLLTTFKQSLLRKIYRKKNKEQKLDKDNEQKNHHYDCTTTIDERFKDVDIEDLEFDILLLDLYMPELDGFDVAKAIRQMELEYHQWMSVSSSSIPNYPSSLPNSLFSSPCPLKSSEKMVSSTNNHKDTYIMALSATSKLDDRTKALQECQMDFFMNKPFKLSNLTGVLADVKKKRDIVKKLIGEKKIQS